MADKTAISWTDKTFNHVRGCVKVSEACKNCYADTLSHRNPKVLGVFGTEASGGTRVVAAEKYWKDPLKWDAVAQAERNLFEIVSMHPVTSEIIDDTLLDNNVESWLNEMAERGLIEQRNYLWYPLEYHAPRVFCASLADVFEDWDGPMLDHHGSRLLLDYGDSRTGQILPEGAASKVAKDWCDLTMGDVRARLFRLIDRTPNLTWQLLTKRPENIRKMWPVSEYRSKVFEHQESTPEWKSRLSQPKPSAGFRRNVWLGTTVENQQRADERIPHLVKLVPNMARVAFLSMEPLLGPVDIVKYLGGRTYRCNCGYHETESELIFLGGGHYKCADCGQSCDIDGAVGWVIVGVESGPNRRETKLEWIRDLRDQCKATGVPFFVKQLEVDGKVTGDVSKFPEDLQIQEFPSDA